MATTKTNPEAIYITGMARTPMGGFQGALSSLTAPQLGSVAIRSAIERAHVDPAIIDEVIMGCVLAAGLKQGPARQASKGAGLGDHVGCTTLNKLCGSGMKSTMFGMDSIRAGSNQIIISGGMESMTNAPYLLKNARQGYRIGHQAAQDHMFTDGLEDAYTGRLMGEFAQETADKYQISREEMDEFAINSLSKAQQAIENGDFNDEIAAVTITDRRGNSSIVDIDEQPGNARPDKIPKLKPAFQKDGSITAANSSSISDGASALLLQSEQSLQTSGSQAIAKIIQHSTHSRQPSEFTIAPIGAIQQLLQNVHWSIDDVDLFEINEAFAVVSLVAIKELNLDASKVNIYGGACALGHPIGSSGSRIIVTLVNALKRTGGKRGVAALCIGGGEATAVAIELS